MHHGGGAGTGESAAVEGGPFIEMVLLIAARIDRRVGSDVCIAVVSCTGIAVVYTG